MKKFFFLSAMGMLLFSCHDSMEECLLSDVEKAVLTRSVNREVSPIFDWEDTTHISLFNVPGSVVLPWYSGAVSGIPSFILDSYKAADGWQLVYNTCSSSNMVQDDKYYLLFYNVFSGKLRGYVYNKNDVTSGDMTFWQLTFNNATTLLNDLTPNTTPGTTPVNEREMLVSNLSVNPTKALSRGWNVFEADLLTYDPNMSDKNIAFTISAYDMDKENINLVGNVDLTSNGTMLTTTTMSSFNSPALLSKEVSLLGDAAKEKYEKMFENQGSSSRSFFGGSIAEIIKAGGNFLVNKFFGRASTQTIQSNSDIKISTDGIIQANGQIVSKQQSNISPLSRLMLPGSNPTPEDIFLPSYDKPLGVWYLEKAPVVNYSVYEWFFPTLDAGKRVVGCHGNKTVFNFDEKGIKVVLNPAVESLVDRYEVSSRYLVVRKATSVPSQYVKEPAIPGPIVRDPYINYRPLSFKEVFFSAPDSLLVLAGASEGSFAEELPLDRMEDVISGAEYTQILNYGVPSSSTTERSLGIVKVTVTLYPKAPYNTAPIVTTRTFVPEFIRN